MKLLDLAKYQQMSSDDAYEFALEKQRTIRVEFLCAYPTAITLDTPDGSVSIGLPAGQQRVQFSTTGKTVLSADRDVSFYTSEFFTVHAENLNPKKFTTVAVRQERNPELEKMVHTAMKNVERRTGTMLAEMQASHEAELERVKEANEQKPEFDDKPEGAASDDAKAKPAAGSGGAPAQPKAEAANDDASAGSGSDELQNS